MEEIGRDDDAGLRSFLDYAALAASIDAGGDKTDAVKMLTVHGAKGMEFDVVFLCGLSEGCFPSKRSSGPDDIEEERRLAYVALTRARKQLMLSDAEGLGHDGGERKPSRFIYEMGIERLVLLRHLPSPMPIPEPMADASAPARFTVGQTVEHPVFGRGIIEEIDTKRSVYIVKFDKMTGMRTLRFGAPLDAV